MLIVNMLLYLFGFCKSCNVIVIFFCFLFEIFCIMVLFILLFVIFFKFILLMILFIFIKKNLICFFWNINFYKFIYFDKVKIRYWILFLILNFLVWLGSCRNVVYCSVFLMVRLWRKWLVCIMYVLYCLIIFLVYL